MHYFKHPDDKILGKDTFYVESFNNVMNIFEDKRIVFGDDQYSTRSNFAVFIGMKMLIGNTPQCTIRTIQMHPEKGRKCTKKLTFTYQDNICS